MNARNFAMDREGDEPHPDSKRETGDGEGNIEPD
jgi:hypothetical protein